MNFPGESPGLLATAANWEPTDYVSLPIGQVDAVSALQVLDAYNTVANGGVYVAPKLVQATVSPSGTLTTTAPSATHTAISPSVDSELTSMLEQVVNTGTGTSAAVPGYTVAGKTGTAQIPTQGHDSYVHGRLHGVLRRVRAGRQPDPVHDRRPQPAHADLRGHRGRTRVLPDHELRPAPLRHPHHPRRADHDAAGSTPAPTTSQAQDIT